MISSLTLCRCSHCYSADSETSHFGIKGEPMGYYILSHNNFQITLFLDSATQS